MKFLLIMWLGSTLFFTLFGTARYNGRETNNLISKFIVSLICCFIFSLIVGLPILGIAYLISQ